MLILWVVLKYKKWEFLRNGKNIPTDDDNDNGNGDVCDTDDDDEVYEMELHH